MSEFDLDCCKELEDRIEELRKNYPNIGRELLYISHMNKLNALKIEAYEKMLKSLQDQVDGYAEMMELLQK